MKKYLPFIFLVALMSLSGCDDDDSAADKSAVAEISIDEDYYLTESDNVQTFTVKANKAWVIAGANEQDWLSIEPAAGGAGDHTVTIKSKTNTTYSYRKASLTFLCGTIKKEFSVTQVQNDALILSEPSFDLDSDGGIIEVVVKSNIDFAVEIPEGSEWIEQVPVSRTKGLVNHVLRFKVSEYNGTTAARAGAIIINATNEDKSQTIPVIQGLLSGKLPNVVVEDEGSVQTVITNLTTQPDTITTLNVVGKIDSLDMVYLSELASLKELKMGRAEMVVAVSGKVRFPSKVFSDHPTLKTFAFPRNIEVIGAEAFLNAKQLTCKLEFPENVESIEAKAFASSSFKGGLELPAKLTYMGANAFDGCTSFNGGLVIPATLTEIPAYAFNGCNGFIGQLTIPETVTSIGNRAFYNCQGFKGDLVIPESVELIGASAFQQCVAITSVKFSTKLTEIPASAFSGCSALAGEIKLPENITSIGASAFYNCKAITSVNLPDNLTEIGNSAFQNCNKLAAPAFPDLVKTIGNNAFNGCTAMQGELVLPAELEKVSNSSFRACTGITGIQFNNKLELIDDYAFYGCTNITALNLPVGLKKIGTYAFRGVSITELVVPSGVTSLNGFAFCSKLTTVTVAGTVTEIGASAFQHCSNLAQITFEGNNVTTFSNYCFNNTGFVTFTCPESVTTFGKNVFTASVKLTEITFPSSLTSYPEGGASQTKITHFEVPEGVETLGASFFYNCSALEEVVLPSSINRLYDSTLSNCSKLTKLTVKAATPPTITRYTISNVNSALEIYVPASSVTAYQAADYWKNYTIKAIN